MDGGGVMGSAVHIGVGDGPLCLGLLAAVTGKAKFERHVIARPNVEHGKTYLSTVYMKDGSSEKEVKMPVTSFAAPDGDEVPVRLARALAKAELVLITVALRDGIGQRTPFVHAVVDLCAPDAEVVFAACENSLTQTHLDLIQELRERGVHCPRTIVDRICFWPPPFYGDPPAEKPNPRHVFSHEVGEWLIERDEEGEADRRLRTALEAAEEVEFIQAERYDAYAARKAWLVNGVHLYVAAAGRVRAEIDLLPDLLSKPRVRTPVEQLAARSTMALELEHGMSVAEEWIDDRMRAIFTLPDSCRRILKSFSRRKVLSFIRGFDARIAAPARIVNDDGGEVVGYVDAARLVSQLLQGNAYYQDWYELRPGELTAASDREAVDAFREALEGWFPQQALDDELRDLASALTSQRAVIQARDDRGHTAPGSREGDKS